MATTNNNVNVQNTTDVECYRFLTIYNKLQGNVKLSISGREESYYQGDEKNPNYHNLSLYPSIDLKVMRPRQADPNTGNMRAAYYPNDNLYLTPLNLPTFTQNLSIAFDSLYRKDLFVYNGNNLEVNPAELEGARISFLASGKNSYVNIEPVVIEEDDRQVEGLKFVFNREPSSFSLTIPELNAFKSSLNAVENTIHLLAMSMYQSYKSRSKNHK